jgi:hypothetical protein
MTRSLALGATVASTIAIALAYVSAFISGGTAWGSWLMVLGLATMVVSLIALGAVRQGRGLGPLRLPLAFTFLVLVGGFGAALSLPASEASGVRLYGGLPLRAAFVLYGVGLLPLFFLPLVYAMTFDSLTLTEADLERVRAMRIARLASDGSEADAALHRGAGDQLSLDAP